jgi:hypothetical protein
LLLSFQLRSHFLDQYLNPHSDLFFSLDPADTMAAPNDIPKIAQLATQIGSSVAGLQQRLLSPGVPLPSFAEEGPQALPADVCPLRDALLHAIAKLHELLLDPMMLIFKFASILNMISIDAINRYQIPTMLLRGGQISFEKISERSGLDKELFDA